MKEERCSACGHPKSYHDGTDTLYLSNPEKFAPSSGNHEDSRDMCQLRSCVRCHGWNKIAGWRLP